MNIDQLITELNQKLVMVPGTSGAWYTPNKKIMMTVRADSFTEELIMTVFRVGKGGHKQLAEVRNEHVFFATMLKFYGEFSEETTELFLETGMEIVKRKR